MANQLTLDQQFVEAVKYVRDSPSTQAVTDDTKLMFYAYYKQATVGDINIEKPRLIWVKQRAKWNAWNSVKGMSKESAKSNYVSLLHVSSSC